MSRELDEAKKSLRRFLNPAIQGPNTEAILDALAQGGAHLIKNVEAVHDNLYVASASGRYLEQRLSDKGLSRPPSVGLDDDTYRLIGIEVSNRKQVRDLINSILSIIYGDDLTKAQIVSSVYEPYNLNDQDTLNIQFDDGKTYEVILNSDQFSNISIATAQEVSDAITKQLRKLGSDGFAFVRNDGLQNYVAISSPNFGPSSSIRIRGGKTQSVLKFPTIRSSGGQETTIWKIEAGKTGIVKMIWFGGSDPTVGKASPGDYINIYNDEFSAENQGTFTIINAKGGSVGKSYIEFLNPAAVPETVTQIQKNSVLFFEPTKRTIISNINYAAAFQSESNVLEVFLPAITKVVRRDRIGAAHVIENSPFTLNGTGEYGPYVFDTTKGYQITKESATTTEQVNQGSGNILNVLDSSSFPDSPGFICLNYGTELEEGPIQYVGRPSSKTLLLNPEYKFKNVHPANTDVSLIGINSTYTPDFVGRDYPLYLTDISSGRIYAEELINLVAAVGLNLIITILYPDPIGLSKWEETDPLKQEWKNIFGA